MKIGKCTALIAASWVFLSLGSCAADLGYYALDVVAGYLPDLLDTLLGTASQTA
jgi:hypothetical protein